MIPTLWWWLLIGALAVLFNAQLKSAWTTVLGLVANVASDARCAVRDLHKGSIQLIQKAGEVDPGKALASFVLASFAALAFWADLLIMRQSLVLIAPWPESAQLLAITMVSLTAGMGFLLHNVQGWLAKSGILAFALTLLGGQFLIARERVAQLNEMQASETQFEDSAGAAADFFVNGERVELGGEAATPTSSTPAENDRLPNLGGMQALQFACAEIVLIWGAVALGTAAICWVAASPFLLLLTSLGAGAHLTARLAEAAAKAGAELLGVLEVLRSSLQRAAKLDVGSWLQAWRLQRKQRRHERDQKTLELRADARLREEARLTAAARSRHEHQQQALAQEFEAQRNAREHQLLTTAAEVAAESFLERHTTFAREIADRGRDEQDPLLQRILSGFGTAITKLYSSPWMRLERSSSFFPRNKDQEAMQ